MGYNAPLTNEERRSCRRTKAGQLPEPSLGELGQAEAELGLGPSSCSARPSSPPARPGSTIFPFGCHTIVRLLQALYKAILAPFSSFRRPFRVQQEARQPRGRGAPS